MNVERHAFDTYDTFLKTHGDVLKLQPPPQIAVDYYEKGDLSLFDAFHHVNLYPHTVGTPATIHTYNTNNSNSKIHSTTPTDTIHANKVHTPTSSTNTYADSSTVHPSTAVQVATHPAPTLLLQDRSSLGRYIVYSVCAV